MHRPSAIERAFELAKSGRFDSLATILRVLKGDGYYDVETTGPALRRQLKKIMRLARVSQNA